MYYWDLLEVIKELCVLMTISNSWYVNILRTLMVMGFNPHLFDPNAWINRSEVGYD